MFTTGAGIVKSGESQRNRVAVIGAGPGGLAAALSAAGQGVAVTVFEQLPVPGRRLLATGGGHCNFTNVLDADEFSRRFGSCARFVAPAFKTTGSEKLRALFEELGVSSHCPDGFHVFPVSNSAVKVRDALVAACERLGVQFRFNACVRGLVIEGGRIVGIDAGDGREQASAVVVAAGGASRPELGGGRGGLELAASAGHSIIDQYPALVPLVTQEIWPGTLAGVTVPLAIVRCPAAGDGRAAGKGPLLFTHRGISGPAVLDVSGTVAVELKSRETVELLVDLAPGMTAEGWRRELDRQKHEHGTKSILSVLRLHFPAALARVILDVAAVPGEITMSRISAGQRDAVIGCVTAMPLTVTGTEGMSAAMACSGGVSIGEIDRKTMASKLVVGLFFAGEIMDVQGPCGGFNLHWAFASGLLAGEAAAKESLKAVD